MPGMFKSAARKALSFIVLKALRCRVEFSPQMLCALERGGCIITANHHSLADGPLVAFASPVPLCFAIDPDFSQKNRACVRALRFMCFMGYGSYVALDQSSPYSMRSLAKKVRAGESVVIFPSGRITVPGENQKMPGLDWLIAKSMGTLLELRLEGFEHLRWLSTTGKRLHPKLKISSCPP